MAVFHAQVSAMYDTAFPRDRLVNVLSFDRPLALPADGAAIAGDIATLFDVEWYTAAPEITVKLYAEGPAPQPPFAEATINAGVIGAANGPREVALVLSHYSEFNRPRMRGRVFLAAFPGGAAAGPRPTSFVQGKALALGQGLSDIGGADIDWGVWSPTDQAFRAATNIYVDDEWDTIRSRGLRPTSRAAQTTSG